MATSKEDMQKNDLTYRRYKEGDSKWSSMNDLIFNEDTSHKCPTYVHRTPPCQGSCPSGEDIRGWLDIIRGIEHPPEGMTKEEYAFQRSTTANPFPAMMGRVCPAPCETGCNRNDLDDFVGINSVEQYIGDSAFSEKYKFGELPDLNGKKVAIIGGGVAGMSAAYHLRKFGIASTIFDDHADLGGMMRYGIPGYRTPRDIMDHECMRILNMGGIEAKMNTRVGKDVPVAELEKEYDAVLWALGCKKGRGLFIEDWKDVPNAVTAVDFLEQFNKGEMKYTGKNIVCVGGGDTSIDVVSVARRIGTLKDFSENPEDSATGTSTHGDIDAASKKPCDSVVLTLLCCMSRLTVLLPTLLFRLQSCNPFFPNHPLFFIIFTCFTKRIAEVVMSEDVIRINPDRLPESGYGFINPVAGLQGRTKVCIDLGTFSTTFNSLIKQSDCSFMLTTLVQQQTQHVKGIEIVGVSFQDLAVKRFSLLQFS